MKQYFFFLATLCLFYTGITNAQRTPKKSTPAWYQVKAEAGGFSVKFPEKPVIKIETNSNRLNINSYSLTTGAGIYFNVSYFDFPAPNQESMSSEMKLYKDEYISRRKVQSLSSNKIRQGGCEGQEYIGLVSPTRTMYWRLFTSGQKVYMVTFESSSNTKQSNDIGRYFLDSFKISDDCTGRFTAEVPSDVATTNFIPGVADSFSGWKKIVSLRDEFELLMPGGAKVEETQILRTPFPISKRFYTSENQTATYLVEVMGDYPKQNLLKEKDFGSLLDIMNKNLAEDFSGTNSKITFVRNLSIGTFPGREYNLTSNDITGRIQIFITPKRSYTFIFSELKANYLQSNSDRFFNSIRMFVK